MMRLVMMRGFFLTLTVALVGASLDAAGPGGHTSFKKKHGGCSKTVTTTVLTSPPTTFNVRDITNFPQVIILGTATGTATYTVTTVTTRNWCGTSTKTNASLSMSLSSTVIPEGTSVNFNVISPPSDFSSLIPGFGKGTITNGQATFVLSTTKGDTVPKVGEGDFPYFGFAFGNVNQGWNTADFGAPVTTVTTSGH